MNINGSLQNILNEKCMEIRGPIEQRTAFDLLVLLYSRPDRQ